MMKRITFAAAIAASAALAAPSSAQSVDGFGSDIPLAFAVKQVVPEGYQVSFGAGVDAQSRVSWQGGSDWHAVLDTMARGAGLQATYEGQSVRLTKAAFQQAAAATSSPSAAPAPQQQTGGFVIVPYRAPAPAPAAAPSPAPVASAPSQAAQQPSPGGNWQPYNPSQSASQPSAQIAAALPAKPDMTVASASTWKVQSGQTLREVLQDWATQAKWSVAWKSEYEYPMEAGATFTGDFIEVTSSLIKSLAKVRPAVTISFFKGNRVIVIANDSSDEVN